MNRIQKLGLVLAAFAVSFGVAGVTAGPAHADTSWGTSIAAD